MRKTFRLRALSKDEEKELVNIRPFEVSLVKKPANKRAFFIVKGKKMKKDKLVKALLELAEGEIELDEELIKKASSKNLSADTTKELKKSVRTLERYQEDFPAEVNGAIAIMCKAVLETSAVENDDDEESGSVKETLEEISEALNSLSKNQKIVTKLVKARITKNVKNDGAVYTQKDIDEIIQKTIDETMTELGLEDEDEEEEDEEDEENTEKDDDEDNGKDDEDDEDDGDDDEDDEDEE